MSTIANAPEPSGSVTRCLQEVKRGDSVAQHQLWERYLCRLLGLARHRLRGVNDPLTEADDLASVVFHEFLLGVEKSRFQKIDDRHDLWQVLVMLTNRRAIDRRRLARAHKRSAPLQSLELFGQEQQAATIAAIASRDPTPEEAALLSDEIKHRLASLGDQRLEGIAMAKLQGVTNQQIADQLGCSTRSVERKLAIIRRKWLSIQVNS